MHDIFTSRLFRFTSLVLIGWAMLLPINSRGQLPSFNFIANATNICVGNQISFYVQPQNDTSFKSYQWVFSGAIPGTSTSANPNGIKYSASGFYDVQLTVCNSQGCSTVTKPGYIRVGTCLPPKAGFYTDKTVVCKTTCNLVCVDTSSNSPTSWQWFFQGGTPSSSTVRNPYNICYNDTGYFNMILIVSNPYGSDTVIKSNYIHVIDTCPRPVADFIAGNDTICNRTCINFTNLTTTVDPNTTYSWYFQGGSPDSSYLANPACPLAPTYDNDGIYDVMLVANSPLYGVDTMIKTGYINVISVPGSSVFPNPDTSVYFGSSALLHAEGGFFYQWMMDTTLIDTTDSVVVTPAVTTTYTCIISDSLGCSTFKPITVNVLYHSKVFVPNTFAPDQNGQIMVHGNNIRDIHWVIYDRWGERIFESLDQYMGWDGTFHGKKCNTGVYVYSLTVTFNDGQKHTENGNITLLR